MKKFTDLISDCLPHVKEIFPWDMEEHITENPNVLILDVREPGEFSAMHIRGSLNAPRGILESACEFGYEDTIPELAAARKREIIVVCRSGNRSVLAAHTMQQMGYQSTCSLKTGLRGWNDYELALVDGNDNSVAIETADQFFTADLRPEQKRPVT